MLKNAVFDFVVLSVIHVLVSCAGVVPLEESQETKQTNNQVPSRPQCLSEPAYFYDDEVIKTELVNWLKYFSYYGEASERYQGASLYENDEDSETVLMLAAALGDIQMMKKLIHQGADVNRTSKLYNETPLHYAAYKGRMNAYAFLVKNGAKQDVKSIDEASLMSGAASTASGALLQKRDFKLRTPKQLLQRKVSDAIAGKYKGN